MSRGSRGRITYAYGVRTFVMIASAHISYARVLTVTVIIIVIISVARRCVVVVVGVVVAVAVAPRRITIILTHAY